MPTDIKSLDLNLLKALDALLDERSVTRCRASGADPAGGQRHADAAARELRRSLVRAHAARHRPTLRALALAGPLKELLCNAEALLRPRPLIRPRHI
jgi:hypothetical protein